MKPQYDEAFSTFDYNDIVRPYQEAKQCFDISADAVGLKVFAKQAAGVAGGGSNPLSGMFAAKK